VKYPKYLGKAARDWLDKQEKTATYTEMERESLYHAAHCLDRIQEARELLEKEGMCFSDRFDQIKPHPATVIELNNKRLFRSICKEIFPKAVPLSDKKDELSASGFDNL
jgi:hypothetical protein